MTWAGVRRRPASATLLGVLALHLLIVGWLSSRMQAPRRGMDAGPVPVNVLWLLETPPPVLAPQPDRTDRTVRTPAAPVRKPDAVSVPMPAPTVILRPLADPALAAPPQAMTSAAAIAAVPDAAAPAPAPAASSAPRPLLQDPAQQRLIRQLARGTSVAQEAARITGEAPALTDTERLGRDVARSAKGDCLKGEFVGGGMGLLSLPFWAAAELGGQCRR